METREEMNAEVFGNSSDFDVNGGGANEPEYDIFAGWDDGIPQKAEADGEPVASEADLPEPAPEEEQEAQQADAETEAPTTEQTEPKKLSFRAKIDHKEQDVSIREDELPAIYQKAQNADRAERRASEAKATADTYKAYMDKMARVAGLMNFSGETLEGKLDALYEGIVGSAKESKVKELVEAGTAQEVAEFVVNQQMKDAEQGMATAGVQDEPEAADKGGNDGTQQQPPTPEQFQQDLQALFARFPDAAGDGAEFPHEVMEAYIRGENLTVAYMDHRVRNAAAENQRLKEQNRILQQNQASAKKAPIHSGVSGSTGRQKAEDPMLAGFDDKGW